MNKDAKEGNPTRQGGAVACAINPSGKGAFLLVCEHASNHIPLEYDNLGLPVALRNSHIAWDPGAAEMARKMSELLDSPLVLQGVSRLVIDCNRPPMSEDAIPAQSEIHQIPGNASLSEDERRRRGRRYYEPFCELLSGLLKERAGRGRLRALLTVHSFSPVYAGVRRDMDIGLIDHDDPIFAEAVFARLSGAVDGVVVRRNAPYNKSDGVTHTLALHAQPRGLMHVMMEVRNDLIAAAADQTRMAEVLADAAQRALEDVVSTAAPAASA